MEKRVIKFRMWTGVKMLHDTANVMECLKQQIAFDTDDHSLVSFDHVGDNSFFMQFTGLHDKNGKEIYEGDIKRETIEYDEGDEVMYFVCVWFAPMSAFVWMSFGDTITVWEDNTEDGYPFALDPKEQGMTTICGNIHEHPELLRS